MVKRQLFRREVHLAFHLVYKYSIQIIKNGNQIN